MKNTQKNSILIFKSKDGPKVNVTLTDETVWLTQAQMTDLFERNQSVISRHIRTIFKEKELKEKSNMQKMHIPNSDKPVTFYSLDVIISVGYRVKSKRGTQFRIWANRVLKDYLLQGYVLNEKQLKEQTQKIKTLESTIKSIVTAAHQDALTDTITVPYFKDTLRGTSCKLMDEARPEAYEVLMKLYTHFPKTKMVNMK